jgi:hypothetical protein
LTVAFSVATIDYWGVFYISHQATPNDISDFS